MKKTADIIIILIFLVFGILACEEGGFSSEDSSAGSETGTGGSMARFTIAKDHLYIVDHNSLKSFDISEENDPQYVDSTFLGFDIETIFPFDNSLFIGTRTGMHIYDIETPAAPVELSVTRHFYSCDPVVTDGQYAYVTLNSANVGCGQTANLLEIYNIDNLKDPFWVADYEMKGPKGLAVKNEFLFVCDNGLKIYDKSDIKNLQLLQHISDITTYDVIVNGDLLLVVGDDGFYQYYFDGETATKISEIEKLSAN
ncbi:MAG: hypothetical protein GVY19_09755 [Bacteroidetes bacterium]|jgi:hypothetical protein|nr:hypothetical protein [Bacteroidota bacterium]